MRDYISPKSGFSNTRLLDTGFRCSHNFLCAVIISTYYYKSLKSDGYLGLVPAIKSLAATL
jgi:hypothetical protein